MDFLLRKVVEWKGRRKAAQIIVFDGAAEIERTRSFVKGCITGIVLAMGAFALAAPSVTSPTIMQELANRESLLDQANERADQAIVLADVCVRTAQGMEQTLSAYRQLVRQ
jgi:hypothetical protein